MKRKDRKPYRKPEVTRVRLVAEEAVLANCKTSGALVSVAGMINNNCLDQWTVACSVIAS